MQVIMLSSGELKNVAAGYARNYLLPNQLAVVATAVALQQAEATRARVAAEQAVHVQEFQELAQRLSSVHLTVPARANDAGKLFAALHPKDILQALAEQSITLDEQYVQCEPIKKTGEYSVIVRLPDSAPVRIPLTVQPA